MHVLGHKKPFYIFCSLYTYCFYIRFNLKKKDVSYLLSERKQIAFVTATEDADEVLKKKRCLY